jgi:multimeric flavodoxin WrbA
MLPCSAAKSVLLATPIYRGMFTAALKNLLDWLPLESLEGKRVGLIASGATPHHYLMIDLTLRPLLAWFNAAPIPGSVYLTKEHMSHEGHPCEATAARLDALAQALVAAPPVVGAVGPPALMRQLSAPMGNRIAPSACKAETTPIVSRTHWLTRLTQRTVRG